MRREAMAADPFLSDGDDEVTLGTMEMTLEDMDLEIDNDGIARSYFECAAEGNVETLRILLMSDPSGELLNSVDVDGFSALMIAAAEGNSQVVLELLRQGADANLRTFELKSAALHFAAKNGDPVIVEEMCKHTKQIDFWNVNADTPLVWACIEGRDEAVRILLKYGADPRVTNHYGATTLMCATMIGEDAAENSDSARKNIVAMLLEKCPEMANAQDRDGSTAMHLAASCGYLQCVQELLARGADITIRNAIGQTPLEEAELTGCKGSEKCVEFLKSRWVVLEEEAKARMMTMLEMEDNVATTPAKKSKKKKKAKKSQKKKPKVTQAIDSPESEGHSDTEALPNEEPETSKIKTYHSDDDNSSPWTTVSRKQTPSAKAEPKKKEPNETPSQSIQSIPSTQQTPQSAISSQSNTTEEPSPSPTESSVIIAAEPSTPARTQASETTMDSEEKLDDQISSLSFVDKFDSESEDDGTPDFLMRIPSLDATPSSPETPFSTDHAVPPVSQLFQPSFTPSPFIRSRPAMWGRFSAMEARYRPSAIRGKPKSSWMDSLPQHFRDCVGMLACGFCGDIINDNVQCTACTQLYCHLCVPAPTFSCVRCGHLVLRSEMHHNTFAQAQAATVGLLSSAPAISEEHTPSIEALTARMYKQQPMAEHVALHPTGLVPGEKEYLGGCSMAQLDVLEEMHYTALKEINETRLQWVRNQERMKFEEELKTQHTVYTLYNHQ